MKYDSLCLTGETDDNLTDQRWEKSVKADKISQTTKLLAVIDTMEALKGAARNATMADQVVAELKAFAEKKLKSAQKQGE